MITVLGRNNSINVQKVMWTASEVGCKVNRQNIGGDFGGNDTQKYLSQNPTGQIPTLIDDGFILWESNTIVRYLSEKYGNTNWQPNNPRIRFLGHQWMDFYTASVHPPMTTIFWQLIRTPSARRDETAVELEVQKAAKFWGLVNEHLKEQNFMLGAEPSFGDVPLGCAAYRWHKLEIARPNYYHLEAWFERLTQRPAYQQHVMLPLT